MAYYQFLAFKKSDVTYYGSNNLSSASSVYLPSSNGITIYISDGDVIGNSSIDPGEADVSLSPLVPQPSGSIAVPDTDQLLGQDIPGHAAGEQVYVTAARSVDLPGGDLDDAKIIEFTIGSETFVTAVHTRLSPYTDSDLLDKELKVTDWANSEYPWREQYDQLLGNYYAPDILGGKITCFTLGTLIETNEGNKPIEELQPGDLIATMDDGYQPIRWIGQTTRDAIDLARNPKLKPIRIAAGALGNGLPERDLTVSRQHRVLIRSKIAQRMFGAEEILIPAIRLVGLDGIEIIGDCEEVTYFHILFDKHQVIFSEDAPTESLFTGPVALQSVSPEARKEIETLFPEITKPDFVAESARPIPEKGAQIRQLVARHKKRGMPLLNG